jgi:hypothetical protein
MILGLIVLGSHFDGCTHNGVTHGLIRRIRLIKRTEQGCGPGCGVGNSGHVQFEATTSDRLETSPPSCLPPIVHALTQRMSSNASGSKDFTSDVPW